MKMEEIRLDFLQNPKIDYELLQSLSCDYNLHSIANNDLLDRIMSFRSKLANMFFKSLSLPFSFNCAGFLELFLNFKNIYVFDSCNYEIRKASSIASNFINVYSIKLDSINIENNSNLDSTLVIAPYMHEDIFSFNDILNLKSIMKITLPNSLLALDISYALALGLDICKDLADIYLMNGVPLSLIRGMGIIISNKEYTSPLYQNAVSEAFYHAITKRRNIKNNFNNKTNIEIFNKLRQDLGDDIDLFASNFAPNTLPLRFKSINTRNLIQHLYLDDIYIQSSQNCHLRLGQPSHTLLSLGFNPSQARELCALSFIEIKDIDFVVDKIIQTYKIIKLMDF